MSQHAKRSSLANTLIAGGGTLCSRLLGFARDASIAWILGGSGTADALTAALRLPFLFRRLFGEGTLSLTLTTACVAERLRGENGLALAVAYRLALYGVPLLALVLCAALPLLTLTAPGLLEREETLNEAVRLFRITAPYGLFALLAACGMAALHSREQFGLPSLAPALFNCVVLGFAIPALFAVTPSEAGLWLAVGVLCGGAAQSLLLLVAASRLGPKKIHTSLVHTVLQRLPLGVLGAAVPQLAFLLASALASLLPEGHMATLFYAERLIEFPLGVLGALTGIVAAPRLAELAEKAPINQHSPFAAALLRAEQQALCLNLPAAAGLIAVAPPLVTLILGHGAFSSEAVTQTANALCAYAPGLPAYALSRPLLAGCQALGRDKATVRAAGWALSLTLGIGAVLLPWLQAWGPPLGVTAGLWIYALLLRYQLREHLGGVPFKKVGMQIIGATLVYATAFFVVHTFPEYSALNILGIAVPAGIVVYAPVLWASRKSFQ